MVNATTDEVRLRRVKMLKHLDTDNRCATWSNNDGSFVIRANNDLTYDIIENGVVTQHRDMSKWCITTAYVVRHIQNDIATGYYPKLG